MGQKLTYDKVLEVLGTVDTEVLNKLLRQILGQNVVGCIHMLEEMITQGKEIGQMVNDFTWYLRNLLLVKNSSDMEEVLDVSTEHLKLLQEESKMVDTETLMRYIRVFSELSGQLRYAAQKRILVEIALIKLCRPAMEQNLDSVLDRLRVLEEKVEQGIPVRAAVPVGSQVTAAAPEETRREERKPEKAAPGDLQQVKREWKMIVGQSEGMFKQMLLTASPKYNGSTGEGKLYVEFTNPLAANYVNNPEAEAALAGLIARRIGKAVEVEFLLAAEHTKTGLADISIDDLIKEGVHMPVVVEENPEEE